VHDAIDVNMALIVDYCGNVRDHYGGDTDAPLFDADFVAMLGTPKKKNIYLVDQLASRQETD
jgi:hypothetical protein